MGGFVSNVVRKVKSVASPKPKPAPPPAQPRAAVVEPIKVEPKAAVGASKGASPDAKVSTMRRRRGRPTQTRLTTPAGDASAAPTSRKTLLGA